MDTARPSAPTSKLTALVLAVMLGALPMGYSYWLDRQDNKRLNSPTPNPAVTAEEARQLAEAAAQFPYVPQGEAPDVFVVTVPDTLFALGIPRRGDAVLVYRQANIAVLYDRQTENIINIIPLPGSGL